MTSTVLDVTVLLLCVSASVVALGGVGDDVGAREPAADEAADRLVTETVTVRYRTAEAANDTRTVHATRAELLALLAVRGSDAGHDTDGNRDGTDENSFESRARDAIAAGIGGRTRIDVIISTSGSREDDAASLAVDRRAADLRSGQWSGGPIAASGTPNAPRAPHRGGSRVDGDARDDEEPRSVAGSESTIVIGDEPPRNVDVATVVVAHPAPSVAGTADPVCIVVRRW